MRNFCGALWHFVKNSFKLTNNNNMDNIQLLNPLKTLDMLWPNTRQTHTQRVLSLSFSLGWTQFSGWLSFICCHRAHTSIVSSSSVFRGRFSPLPALCEMGLIAGIWCKKNGYIYGHVFEPEPEPVPGQCCHWQNRTEQDIPLQVISRICYARVAACDNNNYNCNYINCNITEWASEHVRERGRGRGRCERWPCYIPSDRLRDSEMCVWASVSAAAAAVVAAEA